MAMVDPGLTPVPVVEGLWGGGGPKGLDPPAPEPGGLPPLVYSGPGEGAEGSCKLRPATMDAPGGDGPLLPPPPSCRVPLLVPAGVRCASTGVRD